MACARVAPLMVNETCRTGGLQALSKRFRKDPIPASRRGSGRECGGLDWMERLVLRGHPGLALAAAPVLERAGLTLALTALLVSLDSALARALQTRSGRGNHGTSARLAPAINAPIRAPTATSLG